MGSYMSFCNQMCLFFLFALCIFEFSIAETSVLNKIKYSSKERDALDKFRSITEPELYEDFMKTDEYLIQWIRNQDFNLDKAKDKLSKSLKWRRDNKIDTIMREDFTDLERMCPYSINAQDKVGQPVMTLDIGKCSFRKIALKGQGERLRRLNHYFLERGLQSVINSQKENKTVAGLLVIVDYNGFSMREQGCLACVPIYIDIMTAYDAHYPRLYSRVIGINAPKTFKTLLDTMLPFFPEDFKSIYTVYGHDKKKWQPVILHQVDANQIPKQFGGTKK